MLTPAAIRFRRAIVRAALPVSLGAALGAPVMLPARAAAGAHAPGARGATALPGTLGAQMALMGPSSGAAVYDLTAGRELYTLRAQVRRSPASVEKLLTASTALLRFGGTARLATRVLARGTTGPAGAFTGALYLRGGGDPTFGSAAFVRRHYGAGATVEALAGAVARAGITSVKGPLVADESLFDGHRGGPSAGLRHDPYLTGDLSALAYDRGETRATGGPAARTPGLFAARRLARALRQHGIRVGGAVRAGRTPRDATPLARVSSPPLRSLVGLTLRPSDNFFAEMLLKDLGARFGGGGSTAAGAAVVRAKLAAIGVHPRVVDGSGLSRADHVSPGEVVRLLSAVRRGPAGTDLLDDLAVAGRSGTLVDRMRGTPAAGRCRGKTGSLSDVSALAGFCRAANGDLIVFAFLMNHVSVDAARRAQDRMTVALARYGG